MSYYLCRTESARHPFYIESIGRNIYSLEELCYYLSHYVYLIDETILNEKLCTWIGEELGLAKLQKVLLRALEKGDASEFVLPIFRECGYLKEPELRLFQGQFAQIRVEPEAVRRKMKADYLVDFGMYVGALREYEKLADQRGPGRLGVQFYAAVYENMATAYARLFQFEEAADCLWESYRAFKSKKVYERYLSILPLFLSESKYRKRLEEIRADREEAQRLWEEVRALMQEAELPQETEKETAQQMRAQIEELKKEYIASTMG